MQISFDNVKGYATYERAQKQGAAVAAALSGPGLNDWDIKWLVIAKPDGRFVPAFLLTDKISPSWVISYPNCCVFN